MIQNNFLQNELIYILYILQYEDVELYKQYLIERIRTLILKLDYIMVLLRILWNIAKKAIY